MRFSSIFILPMMAEGNFQSEMATDFANFHDIDHGTVQQYIDQGLRGKKKSNTQSRRG